MPKLPIPFGDPRTYAGHSGVDYPEPRGVPFAASGPGRVRNLGKNARGGNYIWVDYDGPTPPVGYHHMDSHSGCPAAGSRVEAGTRLGYVGNSGHSTGPHLHSEVEGYASTSGYWYFFDSTRVVGQGGGNVTPPNIPEPPVKKREFDMFQIKIKDNDGRYGVPGKWYYAIIGAGFFDLDGPYDVDGASIFANIRSQQFGVPAFNCTYWKWEDLIADSGKWDTWAAYLKSVGKL